MGRDALDPLIWFDRVIAMLERADQLDWNEDRVLMSRAIYCDHAKKELDKLYSKRYNEI